MAKRRGATSTPKTKRRPAKSTPRTIKANAKKGATAKKANAKQGKAIKKASPPGKSVTAKKTAPSPKRKAPVKKTPAIGKAAPPKKVAAKKAAPPKKAALPKKAPHAQAKPASKPNSASNGASATPSRARRPKVSARVSHPKLALLLDKLAPGRHAQGTLIITEPDAHLDQMSRWLGGNVEGRVALGRTAFGDLVVFRDLRARAAAQGLAGAEEACDIALIDLNLKKMVVIAWSVEELLENLDHLEFQQAYLRRELYDAARSRVGDYDDDEVYSFVPALALGGSEDPRTVERARWDVYQDILFQL
jgi:hypothetical protein